MLLQLLIGEIDTELLEAVLLEALKAVDIENAYEHLRVGVLTNRLVDLLNKPARNQIPCLRLQSPDIGQENINGQRKMNQNPQHPPGHVMSVDSPFSKLLRTVL